MASDGEIKIRIALGNAVQQLKEVKGALENLDKAAITTNQELHKISLATQSTRRYMNDFKRSSAETVTELRQLNESVRKLIEGQKTLGNATQKAQKQMADFQNSIAAAATAFLTVAAAVKIFQGTLSVAVKIDSLTKTFYAITGSMAGAGMEMKFVREQAQRLGLDFFALAESYKGFSAAAKFANMDAATTKDIFTAVAESSTVLGLSAEKTKLVLMALEQMVSKGVVTMEELRRQLGDSLPGAFELGARAMGMGLAEFNKFVSSGKLMTEDFLPKLAKTMKETYATFENVALAIKTPRAQIQMLLNELTFAADQFSRSGFLQAVTSGVNDLTKSLQSKEVRKGIADLGFMFGYLVDIVLKLAQGMLYFDKTTKFVLVTLFSWKAFMIVHSAMLKAEAAYLAAASAAKAIYARVTGQVTVAVAASGVAAAGAATQFQMLMAAASPLLGLGALLVTAVAAAGWTQWGEEIVTVKEYLSKFGGTVEEAEAHVARFNMVVGKADPLGPYTKAIAEAKDQLKQMSDAAGKALKSALAIKEADFSTTFVEGMYDALEHLGADVSRDTVDRMIPSKAMQGKINELSGVMQQFIGNVKSGIYKSSTEILAALNPIREAYKEALANADTAEQAEQIREMYSLAIKYGDDYSVVLDNIRKQEEDMARTSFLMKWVDNLKVTTQELAKLKSVFGDTFGNDFGMDIKSFEAAEKLYDKLYAKTKEGKAEAMKDQQAQIDNMSLIMKYRTQLQNQEIQMQIDSLQAAKTAGAGRIEIIKAEILQLQAKGAALDSIRQKEQEIAGIQRTHSNTDSIIEGFNAQIKANNDKLSKYNDPKFQKLVQGQFASDLAGGRGGTSSGTGGASRTDSWIVSMKDKARDATTELQKLNEEFLRLQDTNVGLAGSASVQKIFDDAAQAIRKADDNIAQFQDKYKQLQSSGASGKNTSEAKAQLDVYTAEMNKVKAQIQVNAQLKVETELRNQLKSVTQAQLQVYEEMHNIEGVREKKIELLKQEIELQEQAYAKAIDDAHRLEEAMIASGEATKEQIRLLELLYQRADLAATSINNMKNKTALLAPATDSFGAAWEHIKEGGRKGAAEAEKAYDSLIESIPTTAVQTFAQSTVDAFKAITDGSMSAGEAFKQFGMTMLNMIRDIISQLLVELMVKTLLSKMFVAASGAVVSGSGVTAFASGGVVGGGNGGRIIPLASGGVLSDPQIFGTKSGDRVLAGEAGPEAFVPLGRTREGKLGIETTGGLGGGRNTSVLVVNVYNNAADKVESSQQQGTDDNGNPRLDIFIDQIDAMLAGKIGSGKSSLGRAIDKTRGTSPAKAMYL